MFGFLSSYELFRYFGNLVVSLFFVSLGGRRMGFISGIIFVIEWRFLGFCVSKIGDGFRISRENIRDVFTWLGGVVGYVVVS